MPAIKTRRIKIASTSLSQIVYDFATNVGNIKKAIDLASDEHADILATEELSLVGFPADDYHQWNKDNENVWTSLIAIARYAAEKDPNLVVTVGFPWHYADKTKPANDAAYNITNRPFNVIGVITSGKVVAMSAKAILADGPAEYEPRQFISWPLTKGTIRISLPDGTEIPFGKPVLHLGEGQDVISLTNEICAEAWPGVHADMTLNSREQLEGRNLIALARDYDLSVVLNSSASRPEPAINKEKIRIEGLCKTGSAHCGVYVYTNYLGSSSGTYAAEGSQIFSQNGELVHHGKRYSFKDVCYSSLVVDVPLAARGAPSVTVGHCFSDQRLGHSGDEAAFDQAYAKGSISDNELSYEEYLRSISLWLRDYISKPNRVQGYLVSLSGGKDSAYGAIAVSTMIDLDIQENGVEGFLARFNNLRFRHEVLALYHERGEAAANREIKNRMLTCVYLPTENSSSHTLKAARFLIEGGTLPDGKTVEGIGGRFFVAPVQPLLEETIASAAGLDLANIAKKNLKEILGKSCASLPADEQIALAKTKLLEKIKVYVNAAPGSHPQLPDYIARACVNPLPTWANPFDDLNLQNVQARCRLPIPWTVASYEGQIPLATSNESEAVLSYTTAAGDMHMGGINPIGGMPKHSITQSLGYLEHHGLVGLAPLPSLYWINREKPSAELRKTVAGAAEQTDENDLGFSYEQSHFIEVKLIGERLTPTETLSQMHESPLFPNDVGALRDILVGFTKRWEAGQFKRIMSPLAPHVGNNVDPHQSVRTTVLGDHFHTGCAQMTLEVLKDLTGGIEAFESKFGLNLAEAKAEALLNADAKVALSTWPIKTLMEGDWVKYKRTSEGIPLNPKSVQAQLFKKRGPVQ